MAILMHSALIRISAEQHIPGPGEPETELVGTGCGCPPWLGRKTVTGAESRAIGSSLLGVSSDQIRQVGDGVLIRDAEAIAEIVPE